ncbi:hypothetical protein VHA01S_003_00870 [Vibrio halioticoli NBRC 102217]|uniref:Uncharacterized protein n=1 Tax=Vibrio halioticoli NBRC 102217 TaxID=1219072 RepID=V5FDW2_9VIBR|nr:hypothetical protein [Vibrio halioticoli]GAD88011.1 hypothetical protein VHA01S_003_00870 [Vibrio halioticoli NBRC 102217]
MINFLPWREQIARRKKWVFWLRLTLLPLLVLISLLIALRLTTQYQQQLRVELQALNSEINAAKRIHIEATRIADEKTNWRERLLLVQSYYAQGERPLPIDILPHKPAMQGISLLSFACQFSECEIKGRVQYLHQLSPFMDYLAKSPFLKYLQIEQLLPKTSDDMQTSTLFLISFQLVSEAL